MQNSLTKAQEIKIDNGLVLASEHKLGDGLKSEDVENIAHRTSDADVAARLMARYSAAPEPESYLILARLVMGLTTSYCERAGLIGTDFESLPVVLTAFFMNRISNTGDNAIAQIVDIDAKPSYKLFAMFESYWSTLDTDALIARAADFESESSDVISFRRVKLDSTSAYTVHRGKKHCGHVFWDKGIADPSDDAQGWQATLFDGYPTARYSEDRSNPHAPFLAVSKGELKLHNPQRLSLKDAQGWVRRAMK